MTDFLKIDLDDYEKPALVRLKDEAGREETDVTEARFTDSGVRFTRFGTDKKPKSYYLSVGEMDLLSKAWTDYQVEIHIHEAQKKANFAAAVEEADMLATSVRFDLDSLNIKVEESTSYDGWNVLVPALAYKQSIDSCDVAEHLVKLVQNTFEYIKIEIEKAERWVKTNDEWQAIIASYRRVFPLAEQGGPEEIQRARKLLTEAGIENWRIEPGPRGTWSFYGPFGDGGDMLMPDETPTHLLTDIIDYLLRKESDKELDQMDHEAGIF